MESFTIWLFVTAAQSSLVVQCESLSDLHCHCSKHEDTFTGLRLMSLKILFCHHGISDISPLLKQREKNISIYRSVTLTILSNTYTINDFCSCVIRWNIRATLNSGNQTDISERWPGKGSRFVSAGLCRMSGRLGLIHMVPPSRKVCAKSKLYLHGWNRHVFCMSVMFCRDMWHL
jgi:hypothetical protein